MSSLFDKDALQDWEVQKDHIEALDDTVEDQFMFNDDSSNQTEPYQVPSVPFMEQSALEQELYEDEQTDEFDLMYL